MTVLKHRILGMALAAFVVLAAGCASGGGAGSTGEPGVSTEIMIENIHPGSEALQIYIMADGGVARTPIGNVPQGETRTITWEGATGPHRLIAVRAIGEVTSDRININHNQDFTWTISGNRMLIRRR